MKKDFFQLKKKFLLQGPAHFTHLFPMDTEINLLYTLNPTTYMLFSHHPNIILSPLVGKPPTHPPSSHLRSESRKGRQQAVFWGENC